MSDFYFKPDLVCSHCKITQLFTDQPGVYLSIHRAECPKDGPQRQIVLPPEEYEAKTIEHDE